MKNQKQGAKMENPFKHSVLKVQLIQLFGKEIGEQLTDRPVYRFTQTAQQASIFADCLSREDYFSLREMGYSQMSILNMSVVDARKLASK